MRIITLNFNGIRSAYNKGFLEWFGKQNADILCVQELKAQEADMTPDMLSPHGYHGYFHYAEKKGYSGVGIYCKKKPDNVIIGLGIPEFDAEGRYIEAQFGTLSVVSVYLPSGSSGEERQAVKFKFLEAFMPHLRQMMENSKGGAVGDPRLLPQSAGSASNVSQPHMQQSSASGREVIICGDWNIAHTEKDLKNWKGNKKNSGSPNCSTRSASSMCSANCIPSWKPIPGGRIAARPGRRTWVGAWTIRSPHRASPPKRSARASTRSSASATTRR